MNTKEILIGIREATCRQELSAHIDLIEEAIIREECDFGSVEWLRIAKAIDDKSREINGRVIH